jgi:hypothetical protein
VLDNQLEHNLEKDFIEQLGHVSLPRLRIRPVGCRAPCRS